MFDVIVVWLHWMSRSGDVHPSSLNVFGVKSNFTIIETEHKKINGLEAMFQKLTAGQGLSLYNTYRLNTNMRNSVTISIYDILFYVKKQNIHINTKTLIWAETIERIVRAQTRENILWDLFWNKI